MGYTHYWNQKRAFTVDEWRDMSADLTEILSYVENMLGVPLADGNGEAGTRPAFTADSILFNGIGDDAHETFIVNRKRVKTWSGASLGNDFCKTAEKPYDVAVTACLCYLSSVTETHTVSSNGKGHDFVNGLNAARMALPGKANVLDIPRGVMEQDRWTGPWVSDSTSAYEINFCVDGRGYVQKRSTKEWCCFKSHEELGRFLDANKHATFRSGGLANSRFGSYGRDEPNLWHAAGSFDQARHDRIARAQNKVLCTLFPVDTAHVGNPPAFVRPNDMMAAADAPFHYSLDDLLRSVNDIAEKV